MAPIFPNCYGEPSIYFRARLVVRVIGIIREIVIVDGKRWYTVIEGSRLACQLYNHLSVERNNVNKKKSGLSRFFSM